MLQTQLRRRTAALAVAAGMLGLVAAPAAQADGPRVGTPTVVTLGDSAISGEAGRWAGNTNNESWRTDALGSGAYNDAGNRESTPGCHRSWSAQAHIGGGVQSANLACSGARTYTGGTGQDQNFKPGIDFYSDAQGRKGQALALQHYASTHNVKAVVLMIGANNYGFADILETCVTNWITSPSWWKDYCSDDSDMTNRFTAARQSTETTNVRNALYQIAWAMYYAGYGYGDYTVLAQTYWSPIGRGNVNRYPESGWTRQSTGGCGSWNRDLDWANDVVVRAMNNTTRTRPRRRSRAACPTSRCSTCRTRSSAAGCPRTRSGCSRSAASPPGGLQPGRRRQERVGAADPHHLTIGGPYQLQEDGHANYWGQLAMRNCLRLAYNNGNVRGGYCVRNANGLNPRGEPNMGLY